MDEPDGDADSVHGIEKQYTRTQHKHNRARQGGDRFTSTLKHEVKFAQFETVEEKDNTREKRGGREGKVEARNDYRDVLTAIGGASNIAQVGSLVWLYLKN
mgnify:CR=1 FL=1